MAMACRYKFRIGMLFRNECERPGSELYQYLGQFQFAIFDRMFSRAESSRIRQEFWTTFGRYMSPIFSEEGMKVNWINYHTKVKDVHFRMDAGGKSSRIAITLEHKDLGLQELYFQQFLELKTMLHAELGETWEWKQHMQFDGRVISSIYKELPGYSVFNKEHWPELISFFKPRIIALDRFWSTARDVFDTLKRIVDSWKKTIGNSDERLNRSFTVLLTRKSKTYSMLPSNFDRLTCQLVRVNCRTTTQYAALLSDSLLLL